MGPTVRLIWASLFALLYSFPALAQHSGTVLSYEISIPASYHLSDHPTDAARLQALLSLNPKAKSALSEVPVYSFHQKFPSSHYSYLRNIYEITCPNTAENNSAILSLHNADPVSFPFIRQMPEVVPLGGYKPNDYKGPPGYDCSTQLDFINAPAAWAITKGNPAITIGINDPSGFDTLNPDLVGKILRVGTGNAPDFHGTAVAGCAAAHTDNGIGVAGIGFNCTLDLNLGGDQYALDMSTRGIRIINNSWFYGFSCTHTYQPSLFVQDEMVYDEIYENGTTTCFAAGNGESGYGHCVSLYDFAYPASLDHIITVGPVSHIYDPGVYAQLNASIPPPGVPWMWKYCHEESPGNAIGEDITLNYEANSRVDICAPAYNVVSTFWSPSDSSAHYANNACGTSFASPIVAGALGLMLSANPCLTPYQLEYLLKTNAHSMEFVEYPVGSGINLNRFYVGKMGAGALDAGAAVTAASTFDCNDTATQTMYISGVELSSICAPGYSSNGSKPLIHPVIQNGTPPYTYRWDPMPGNDAVLDGFTSSSPAVNSGTTLAYRLGVYDASPVQKEASRIVVINFTTDQTAKLVLGDSYTDAFTEPNDQAALDSYDWQIRLSPDIVNRWTDDHIFNDQNPVYSTSASNYATARIRNVGCAASTGTEHLNLYWTKASAGERWPEDWTTATFTNTRTNMSYPAGGLITSSPLTIPALQPGAQDTLSSAWSPPNPVNYDPTTATADINLLGRIETSTSAPYGMTNAETGNTGNNISGNNKIAAKNLIINDPQGGSLQWHQILIANADDQDETFNLEFASERQLHPSFSGDISSFARIEVELGDLYDRWVAAGRQGTNVSVDGRAKSVIFSGDSKIILKGIRLNAHEKHTARVGIMLLRQPTADQYFYIRQWLDTAAEQFIPYGNINFKISGCGSDPVCASVSDQVTARVSLSSRVNVFPNPTSGNLSMLYSGYDENTLSYSIADLSGQILMKQNLGTVTYGSRSAIDISGLVPGLYFVKVTDKSNISATIKIVKDINQ